MAGGPCLVDFSGLAARDGRQGRRGARADYFSSAAETRPGLAQQALARLLPAALRYTDFKLRHGLDRQPTFSRRSYRSGTVLGRLQSWAEAGAGWAEQAGTLPASPGPVRSG